MSAPPGYSGESMLQGGTATINPVMGGGGIVDYSFSLLGAPSQKGGDGEEIEVLAAEAAAAATAATAAAPSAVYIPGKGDSHIEYYKFEYKQNVAMEQATISALKNLTADAYVIMGVGTATDSPYFILLHNYETDNKDGQTPTLPATTKNIIVVPPIRGMLEGFDRVLTMLNLYGYIEKDGGDVNKLYITPNTVVIFSEPFYGDIIDTNRILFMFFLQIREENIGKIFVLTKPNVDRGPPYIYEPAIIKYEGGDKGLKFLAAPEVIDVDALPPGWTRGGPDEEGTFWYIGSDGKSQWERPVAAGAAAPASGPAASKYTFLCTDGNATFKPTHKLRGDTCSELYATADLADLSDNQTLGKIADHDMLMIFRLEPTKPYMPSCMPQLKNPNKFNISHEDSLAPGEPFDADLGVIYTLRNPGPDKNGEVYKDWLQGNFNEGEVNYLYSINMSPPILKAITPPINVSTVVADFLYDTVISKCFTDEVLLPHVNCSKNKQLVAKLQEALILYPDAYKAGMAAAKDTSYDDIYGPIGISNELDLIDGEADNLGEPIGVGAGDKGGHLFKTVSVESKTSDITLYKQIKFAGAGTPEDQDALLTEALDKFNKRYAGRWEFKIGA